MDLASFRGLAADVHTRMRERIMAGQLRDGQRIIERDIAEELGVSRGPIREALKLLEAEGLVVTSPRRGTRVAAPTTEDAAEMFAIRAALEPVAATLLVSRGGDEAFPALDEAIGGIERAVRSDDWPQAIAADMQFHGLIFRHSGSRRLRRIWDEMDNALVQIFRLHRPLYRSIDDVLPRHQAYLDVLRRGDVAEVAQHAADHVNEFRERLMAQIADPGTEQP
jgi:GntR family transcriptional regulator of gluconate operon